MKLRTASNVATTVSLIYIAINLFTMDIQFSSSIKLAMWMQSFDNYPLHAFMGLCSFMGFPFLLLFTVAYAIGAQNKLLGYKILILASFNAYFNGLFKIFYSGPRPWYAYPNKVECMECTARDFGRPSGHAMFSLYVALLFYKYIIYEQTLSENVDSQYQLLNTCKEEDTIFGTNDHTRKRFFVAYVVFVILVGVSRVYRGAHSYDQVLLGYSYSIVLYHITMYYAEVFLDNLLGAYGSMQWRICGRHILTIAGIFAMTTVVPIVTYYIQKGHVAPFVAGWEQEITRQCSTTSSLPSLLNLSLYTACMDCLMLGILLGIIFTPEDVFSARPDLQSKKISIVKFLIPSGIVCITGGLYLFLPKFASPIAYYLVNVKLVLLTGSVVMVATPHHIFLKLGIEADVNEEASTGISSSQSENIQQVKFKDVEEIY